MLVARFRCERAAINGGIAVKEEHGIEAKDDKLIGDDLGVEPATILELMALFFWDEGAPDVGVVYEPSVGAGDHDVVREKVVIAECGHDRELQAPCVSRKGLVHFRGNDAIGTEHLLRVTGVVLVIVMAGIVARPDDKVNLVADVVANPVEGGIGEGDW